MENQFVKAVEEIKNQEFVTVVSSGDFGFVNVFVAKVIDANFCRYAQYPNAIKLVFKQPRQKLARYVHLHEGKKFLILKGKHDIKNSLYKEPVSVGGGVSISEGKYPSCDPRWFTDILKQVEGIEPIIYNERGY